jgi:flagellar biosynthetic protein FliP
LRIDEAVNALPFDVGSGHAALPLDVLGGLAILAIVPLLLVMTTSFVRIVVVLGLVRSAIGAQALPPNIVLIGVSLALTFVVMTPTLTQISHTSIEPYSHGKLTQAQLVTRGIVPLRAFMLRQTRKKDLQLFERVAHQPDVAPDRLPVSVVMPAFVVGELRSAFAIGFALYLPFLAIDLAVASILMGLGMFMLSPPVISLPCKLLLFVMVDGWTLVCGGVTSSFR